MAGTKSQDSVHKPQVSKRKESQSGLEPTSVCLPVWRLTARADSFPLGNAQKSTFCLGKAIVFHEALRPQRPLQSVKEVGQGMVVVVVCVCVGGGLIYLMLHTLSPPGWCDVPNATYTVNTELCCIMMGSGVSR